jgi:hypothetical protein
MAQLLLQIVGENGLDEFFGNLNDLNAADETELREF